MYFHLKLTNYEFDQLQIRDLADKLAVHSLDLDIYNLAIRLAAMILNEAQGCIQDRSS